MSNRHDTVELETVDEEGTPAAPQTPRWIPALAILVVGLAAFGLANLMGGAADEVDATVPAISLPQSDPYDWITLDERFDDVKRVVDIVAMGSETIMIVEREDDTATYYLADDRWEEGPVFDDLVPDVVHATRSEIFIGGRRLLPGGERAVIVRGTGTGGDWVEDGVVGGGRVLWFSQSDGVTVATLSRKAPPEAQIAVQLPIQSPLRLPLFTGDLRTHLPDAIETPDGIRIADIKPHLLVSLRFDRVPVALEYDFQQGWVRRTFNDDLAQRDDTTVILPSQEEMMASNPDLASAKPAIVSTEAGIVSITEGGFIRPGETEPQPLPNDEVPLQWDATSDMLGAIEPIRWPIAPTRRVVVDSLVELVSSEDGIEMAWTFLDSSGAVDPGELNAKVTSTDEGTVIRLTTPQANAPLYEGSLEHWNRLHTAITPAPAGVPRILDSSDRWSTVRPRPANDHYTTMDLDLIPGGGVVIIQGTWKDRPERMMMGLLRDE